MQYFSCKGNLQFVELQNLQYVQLVLNKNLYKGAQDKLFIAINPRKKKKGIMKRTMLQYISYYCGSLEHF